MATNGNWSVRDVRDALLEDGRAKRKRTYLISPDGSRTRERDVTPALALEALGECEDRHVIALALRVALRAVTPPTGGR